MAATWMAPFGLADCQVKTWSSAGTYSGTMTDVPSIQQLSVTQQVVSGTLNGDNQITATAANVIGGQAKFRFGGINMDSLGVILGITPTTISSVSQFGMPGGKRMPYFGIQGKIQDAETSGSLVLYAPKCKLMSDFTIAPAEYGGFFIVEGTLQLVPDGSYGVYNLIQYTTDFTIAVFPPANIAVVS